MCVQFRTEINVLSKLTELAAAAKSLQSCPTLCDPIDGSPPGSCPWDSPGKRRHKFNLCVEIFTFLSSFFNKRSRQIIKRESLEMSNIPNKIIYIILICHRWDMSFVRFYKGWEEESFSEVQRVELERYRRMTEKACASLKCTTNRIGHESGKLGKDLHSIWCQEG